MQDSWKVRVVVGVIILITGCAATAWGEDAFYRVSLEHLIKPAGGKLHEPEADRNWNSQGYLLAPRVCLDAPLDGDRAEVYVSYPHGGWTVDGFRPPGSRVAPARKWEDVGVVFRAPAGKGISGRIFLPAEDWRSSIAVRFTVPARDADRDARKPFYWAKVEHYESLLRRGAPGAAWFRHEADAALKEVGVDAGARRPWRVQRSGGESDETYGLLSGGRALSENLQLDRALLERNVPGKGMVPINSLHGITVAGFDWKPMIAGKKPTLDALASAIPVDQHAIFFPGFDAAMAVIDEADRQGTPVLEYAEPRSEDARTKQRYQRQMCLPLNGLGRLLGARLISSVAVTGSDAYLRVGSDVAILFGPKEKGTALSDLLATQMALAAATGGGGAAKAISGKIGGVEYSGYVTRDRRVSAYLATIGDAVVVTNSLAQLRRLADVRAGGESIAAAPEYTFFRDRYAKENAGESAFVVLTDATIRRWCSPRWRIADSRRTRAAAVMAEAQARHLTEIMGGKAQLLPLDGDRDLAAAAGDLSLEAGGVCSATYGTLEFMTPIVEMEMENVTRGEADGYMRWRDTYQQNWQNYFDPIAVRLKVSPKVMAADMTVMPLIEATRYAELVRFSSGAKLLATSGDPHDAAVQVTLAINAKSQAMANLSEMARMLSITHDDTNPLAWVGGSAAAYLEEDPIWLEAAKSNSLDEFWNKHQSQIPIAAFVESRDDAKMVAFVKSLDDWLTKSGMTCEPRTYAGVGYVKVSLPMMGDGGFVLYHTTAIGGFYLTPNEALLKRAIDRTSAARRVSATRRAATQPAETPALGDNVGAQIRAAGFEIMAMTSDTADIRARAWQNLPILNEWKRRFPDRDPVEVHQRLWQVRLVDPGGGAYQWNEGLGTMESTVYGCPESPRRGPVVPPGLQAVERVNFGITFEEQGLRARVELHRTTQ